MRLGMKLWVYENHICEPRSKKIILKEDHRSYIPNFCSCEKKAWKKFRLVRDSNPFSRTGEGAPGMLLIFTLNKPVPRLIRMLFSNWAQKLFLCPVNRRPESIELLYLQCKLDYSPYRECLARVRKLSSRRVFSENGAQSQRNSTILQHVGQTKQNEKGTNQSNQTVAWSQRHS